MKFELSINTSSSVVVICGTLKEFWLKTWNKLTHGFYREGGGGVDSLDRPLPELLLKIQLIWIWCLLPAHLQCLSM